MATVVSASAAAIELAGYRVRGGLLHSTGGIGRVPASFNSWSTPWWAYALSFLIGLIGLGVALATFFPGSDAPRTRLPGKQHPF